jgi:hypothetical protein
MHTMRCSERNISRLPLLYDETIALSQGRRAKFVTPAEAAPCYFVMVNCRM